MNTISFSVNNDSTMKLIQRQHDGATLIVIEDADGNHEPISDGEALISPGDFTMLINFFRYIKSHDYQHDFINPNGANTLYTVNVPVKRPVWKDHKIIGHVTMSRTDADFLNGIHPSDYYFGFTEEEHRLLNGGTLEELQSAGFTD